MRSWAAGRVSEVMSPSCGRNRSPPDRFTSSVVGVRSDRLTAVLLLLQQREQVPAAEVAREPEVYRGHQRATTSTRQAQGATGRGHRLLHHRLAAHRRPHRETTRPHLDQRRPRWQTGADVPVLPHMRVWRSVRAGGETKTQSSRRTLALPHRAIVALREQHDRQTDARQRAGAGWVAHDVVFASANGAALDSANVRRGLRNAAAGLDPMPGRPASCGTASSRCYPTKASRSNRSPA